MSAEHRMVERLEWGRRWALAAFAALGAACALGAVRDVDQFLRSYLLAFLFWLALPLGCFAVAQVHSTTGGAWGLPIRRILEAGARTLPWLALLFVPIALGVGRLYEWAHADAGAADALLRHKRPFLNPTFFLVRAGLYFALWIGAMRVQDRLSAAQDRNADVRLAYRQRTYAAFALVLYGLTMSFASIDWAMSLEPHWQSSLYGLRFVVGQGLSAFAFAIVVAALLARGSSSTETARGEHFDDLGKLLFTATFLWAYLAYSEFLIIWSGNLPEEVVWYGARSTGGWQWLVLLLIVLHFALPFAVLLSRKVKRNPLRLAAVAALLLAMRSVDLAWHVVPAFHPGVLRLHWMDFAAMLALGALWLAAFLRQLLARPLVAPHDARADAAALLSG